MSLNLKTSTGKQMLASLGQVPPTGSEDYSETETVIGTWIDGKPIYRRVFRSTMPASTGTRIFKEVEIPVEVDVPIRVSGVVLETGDDGTTSYENYHVLPYISGSHLASQVRFAKYFTKSTGAFQRNCFQIINEIFSELPVTLIIDYTKESD